MKYDVFVSYHRSDADIARELIDALETVGPPSSVFAWLSKYGIRIISPRDQPGSSTIPTKIKKSLDRANYFIVLASPESAHSPWVQQELGYWLQKHSTNRLIVVLTAGEIETALPADLEVAAKEERLYVDLRWARKIEQRAERYQFRDSVATIAAIIYGISKDAILSGELQRNRRLRLATFSAFGIVSVLVSMLLMLAAYAFQQSRQAQRALGEAEVALTVAKHEREVAQRSAMEANQQAAMIDEMRDRVQYLQRELARRSIGQKRDPSIEEANIIANLQSEVAQARGDLARTLSSLNDYKRRAEEADKVANTYLQQLKDQQNQINELSKSKAPKTALIGDFIARNSVFLVTLIFTIAVLVLFSTRLILQLLQIEIAILKPLAIGFYLLPFGRWKLFRKYRKDFLSNKQVKYHSKHYVDVPFSVDESASDESLTLQQCLTKTLGSHNVTIVAGGGRGKTTLCYRLAQLTLENHIAINGRRLLPVIVDGLSYEGKIIDLLATTLRQESVYVNSAIVESQISTGHMLIMFDGWSEVRDFYSNPDEASDLPDFIRKNPDTRFIFTSRSQLPPAIRRALQDNATFALYDLNEATMVPFLQKYLVQRKSYVEQLSSELLNGPMYIPQSPLMLRLIATVFDQTGEIPKERVTLFSKYADELLRPEAVGGVDRSGLYYVIKHLVRHTYIATDGIRGFSFQKGIELLDQIKTMTGNFGIQLLPIDILKLLIDTGLYKRTGEFIRFFHDSFEGYFAAAALDDDFREDKTDLLVQCATNPRLIETWDFLLNMVKERDEESKLQDIIAEARNASVKQQTLT